MVQSESLLPTAYCRAVTKRESLENTDEKSFNWLTNFDLHLKKLEKLHAIDGRVLMNWAANYMSINFKP